MSRKKGGKSVKLRERAAVAAYGVVAMYFFFMLLDRLLSLVFGANFQPYGPGLPPGFTVWGHMFNGAMALFGVWAWLKLWDFAGRSGHPFVLRAAVSVGVMIPFAWIPYNNDANYLISLGHRSLIPLYVVANIIYVGMAGFVTLRRIRSPKRRSIFLASLFLAFLFVHFVLYAPKFPEFQWT